MQRKIPKLKIRKRGPYGPLLVSCEPVPVEKLEEARPWIIALVQIVIQNKLEGLAANQCGINHRVFITDVRGDGIRIFINPRITIVDYDQEEFSEHCSSYRSPVVRNRHAHVIVETMNYAGDEYVLDTSNDEMFKPEVGKRLSAAIQHEMEHLDGICVRSDPPLDSEMDSSDDPLPEAREPQIVSGLFG